MFYSSLRVKIFVTAMIFNLLPLLTAAAQTSNSSNTAQPGFLEKARASIVLITGEDKAGLPVPPGIGFWIGRNLIATDNRVIQTAVRVHVAIPGQESASMEVISRDSYRFATILTVAKSDASPLSLGDSERVAVNDKVYLMGDGGPTGAVSEGTVSKIALFEITTFSDRLYFQITAPMVSAGRGGPVLNSKGEVIGIAAESPDRKGRLGFAIPSAYLTTLLGYRNTKTSTVGSSSGGQETIVAATPVDTKPVALKNGQPRYTEEARRNQTQGSVIMRILVGEDGEVKETRVTRGLPDGLIEQAIAAAREMKFKPAMRNGLAVQFWLPIQVEFNLR